MTQPVPGDTARLVGRTVKSVLLFEPGVSTDTGGSSAFQSLGGFSCKSAGSTPPNASGLVSISVCKDPEQRRDTHIYMHAIGVKLGTPEVLNEITTS